MTIPLVSGLTGTQQQQALRNASSKLQIAIASLVSGSKTAYAADVASLSTAIRLQSQTEGLRQLSSNLAQAISLTQVAEGGAGQIQNIVRQMKELAEQAQSPALNDASRQQLDAQFQQLATQIDQIVGSTTFNGKKLLNGNISGQNALSLDNVLSDGNDINSSDIEIPDLSANSLFGQQNIRTSAGAEKASAALNGTLDQLSGLRASLGAFQQTLDYTAAGVDSAINNQEAAYATLEDVDLAVAATNNIQAEIQMNAAIALSAQTNNITPALLQLIA